MNLNALAGGLTATVNPRQLLDVRISVGSTEDAASNPTPLYATPGAITASIDGNLMTVSLVSSGVLKVGQLLAGAGLLPGTIITDFVSGVRGGTGVYTVNQAQEISSEGMTTSLILNGQVQPLQYKDMMQMDGLNLQGERKKFYLFGAVDGLVRSKDQGGDLITDPWGNVWLVATVSEQWRRSWVAALATLQNGS